MPDPLPDPILQRRVERLTRKAEQLEGLVRQLQREQLAPEHRFPSIRDFQLLEERVRRLERERLSPDA
jgi:hypothetical protein